MKALIKIFVYAIVASMAFWGCDLSSNVSVSEEQNNAEIEPAEHTTVLFGGPEGCVREMEFIYIPLPIIYEPITDDLAEEPTTDDLEGEPIADDLAEEPTTDDLAEEPIVNEPLDEFTDEQQIYEPIISETPIKDSRATHRFPHIFKN